MKPMLPPDHRTIWSKLDDLKKQHLAAASSLDKDKNNKKPDPKAKSTNNATDKIHIGKFFEDKSYLYAEDPFLVERERKATKEKIMSMQNSEEHKKKMEMRKVMNSVQSVLSTEKNMSSLSLEDKQQSKDSSRSPTPNSNYDAAAQEQPRKRRPAFKKWLFMSKESRLMAESLIKKYHGFSYQTRDVKSEHWTEVSKSIKTALLSMGFPQNQADEALEYTSSLSDALEWLLIHVPEDDLPDMFAGTPETKDSRSTATIMSSDLKFEYAIRDIRAQTGFSEDLIREYLKAVKGNKRLAIVALTHILSSKSSDDNDDESEIKEIPFEDNEQSIEYWNEEMESLEAIYNEDEFISFKEEGYCTFIFEITTKTKGNSKPISSKKQQSNKITFKIKMSLWKSFDYPHSIPGIMLDISKHSSDSGDKGTILARYHMLDLIKRTGRYANEALLDEFMVLSIVEWFKDNFEDVLNNPSRLTDLSSGVSGQKKTTSLSPESSSLSLSKAKITSSKSNTNSRAQKRENKFDAKQLQQLYSEKLQNSPKLKDMIKFRETLPAWQKREEILKLIARNQVVLVTGETGSGKSTQVAQFILDAAIKSNTKGPLNIICSQPRRISAMGLAQRVSDERDEPVGTQVGYIIRGESKTSKSTLLSFVTTGVLLRMIQQQQQSNSPSFLDSISHIMVDEVHERSLDSDFLLILLKRIISQRKDLKVILMSATVDKSLFINYFGGDSKVGYTHIEGRTFPVQDYYLDDAVNFTNYVPPIMPKSTFKIKLSDQDDSNFADDDDNDNDDYEEGSNIKKYYNQGTKEDIMERKLYAISQLGIAYDLISQLVSYIDSKLGSADGSILIFMPGTAEIDRCISTIQSSSKGFMYHTLPLHASLAPAEQRKVFNNPPKGKRKIVVSTNVAETSITIPDIVAVIDTGRVKETKYDPSSNVTRLVNGWTSKAAATQRRGRAGRVREGLCFKLFTKSTEKKQMPTRQLPELLRVPLEQLYLSVKAMGIKSTMRFLSEALDPPHVSAIDRARYTLKQLGALEHNVSNGLNDDSNEALTPLGMHMSMIPTDLRCAKLLVLSAMFGCINTGLIIASIMSLKSPFVAPSAKREEMKKHIIQNFAESGCSIKEGGVGDLLIQAKAYYEWEKRQPQKQGVSSSEKKNHSMSTSQLRKWCRDNFLSYQTLQDIQSTKLQFISSLQEIGYLPSGSHQDIPEKYTVNDDLETLKKTGLVRAVIGASMGSTNVGNVVLPEKVFKNVGGVGAVEVANTDAKAIKIFGPNVQDDLQQQQASTGGTNKANGGNGDASQNANRIVERLFIHPGSSLFETTKFLDDTLHNPDRSLVGYGDGGFLTFARKVHTSRLFIDGLTPLNTYGLVFFSDNLKVDTLGNGVVISTGMPATSDTNSLKLQADSGDWLGLKCWPRIGILVKLLRHLFNNLITQKFDNPELDLSENEVISFIQNLIETNGAVNQG